MDNNKKYDLIEKFLSGDLSQEERQDFEKKLTEEKGLQEEVALHEQIAETLRGVTVHEFREKLNQVDESWARPEGNQQTKRIVHIHFRRALAIAASVALLVLAGLYLFPENRSPSPSGIFANNFEPYKMVLNQRSAQSGISDAELLNEAIQQYSSENFSVAAIAFKGLHQKTPDNIAYEFYYALSLLADNNPADAIPVFENILNTPDHLFLEQSRWYLGLAYLRNGEKERTKAVFEKIKSGEYQYEAVVEILKNLE